MNELFDKNVDRKNMNSIKWVSQKDDNSIPFWIADSDYKTAPCVLEALEKTSHFGAYGYTMVSDCFYKAVSKWYLKRYNSIVKEEWIIPSTGVIIEMRVLLELLTNEGDGVILQTPVYHTFHHLINNLNRKIIENKLIKKHDTYQINYENLEELFKEGHKVLILCSPHNPVGRIWKKEEIEKVIGIAKKYNAFVIFDEIHSDLNITEYKFVSGIDYVNEYTNIAICNAPSKAFNIAGLCVSYIIIPNEELRQKYLNKKERECLNTPTIFSVNATIAAYENGDDWIDSQNEYLKKNYEYLKDYLNKELPEIIVTKLEGTYLVWLDLTFTKLSTEEILSKCDEHGITCSGGVNFCKDYESYIRFNIACPFEQLQEGLKRLVETFK